MTYINSATPSLPKSVINQANEIRAFHHFVNQLNLSCRWLQESYAYKPGLASGFYNAQEISEIEFLRHYKILDNSFGLAMNTDIREIIDLTLKVNPSRDHVVDVLANHLVKYNDNLSVYGVTI
ncbi:MAG: hypothetical protein PHP57_13655 [Sideroxydans sp.]|nr:hypothetical protein [Sideroxydans sp.]